MGQLSLVLAKRTPDFPKIPFPKKKKRKREKDENQLIGLQSNDEIISQSEQTLMDNLSNHNNQEHAVGILRGKEQVRVRRKILQPITKQGMAN